MGGVKVGRSRAQLPLQVEVERLSLRDEFLASLEQHLLLVYTGKTRLARNLLQVFTPQSCDCSFWFMFSKYHMSAGCGPQLVQPSAGDGPERPAAGV